MNADHTYKHTQQAPTCLLLYAIGVLFLVLGWVLRNEPVVQWVFPVVGPLMVIVASSFHQLTVEDEGDRLSVSFGPAPLFRRTVPFADIVGAETSRTTLLDGWGIHKSLRGGWAWNIWGRDCVVLHLKKSVLRIGTDDARQLAKYVNARLSDCHRNRDEDARM